MADKENQELEDAQGELAGDAELDAEAQARRRLALAHGRSTPTILAPARANSEDASKFLFR